MKGHILFLFLLFFTSVQAEHVVLFSSQFNRSVPHYDYNEAVQELKEGDSIEFSNHKTFVLGKRLDTLTPESEKGSRTIIFELQNDPQFIIRIPVVQMVQGSIGQTLRGHKELEYLGPNIVKIKEGLDREYAIVEKLPQQRLSFLDLIINKDITLLQKDKMVNALVLFAKKTARFSELGDFNLTQLTYDIHNNLWILFDWADEHRFFIQNEKVYSTSTVWGGAFALYLKNHSWDEEELNINLPDLDQEQKEKINSISKLLNEATQKERVKNLEKLRRKNPLTCMIIMRELL